MRFRRYSREEIEKIAREEAVINEADLLVELGEYTMATSDFEKPIDAIWLSKIVRQFVNEKDFSLRWDTEIYLDCSSATAYKVMQGQKVKEKTRFKIVKRISEYDSLNLK